MTPCRRAARRGSSRAEPCRRLWSDSACLSSWFDSSSFAEAEELVLDAVELALGLNDPEEGFCVTGDELVGDHQLLAPPLRSCRRPL